MLVTATTVPGIATVAAGRTETVPVIRVLLVDDEPATRRGLRMRLGLEADVTVVGEAGDGSEALAQAAALSPDVVVLDLAMPGSDGIATIAALRARVPRAAIVVLSLYDDTVNRGRALDAGAAAFVGKHDGDAALLTAIRAAAETTPGR
jgi:DNA-binding NarL/FixJ family response regulator